MSIITIYSRDPIHPDSPIADFPADRSESKVATLAERLLTGDMGHTLPYNGARDAGWTAAAAGNWNCLFQQMPAIDPTAPLNSEITNCSFTAPTLLQFAIGTGVMVVPALVETIYRKHKGEELTTEKLSNIWTPVLAGSLAIPMWNLGATIGAHVGTTCFQNSVLWYGSSIAAGMVAAPLAGIFEGFTQWGVRYAVDVATNPVTRKMWREDPALMGKLLTKELILNTTIGAIPGAVWQIVYFFVLPALLAALGPVGAIILTAILIALAVMACNFACTHAINKASSAIDEAMGWDKQFQVLMEQAKHAIEESQKAASSTTAVDMPEAATA